MAEEVIIKTPLGPMTYKQIAKYTGMTVPCIRGRARRLRMLGMDEGLILDNEFFRQRMKEGQRVGHIILKQIKEGKIDRQPTKAERERMEIEAMLAKIPEPSPLEHKLEKEGLL